MNFYDLEWHDAILKKMEVDRSDPGVIDTITFEIDWPDGSDDVVFFEKVKWADIDLHFNFLGADYISDVIFLENIDDDIARYFTKRHDALDTKVNFYRIKSSISEITMLARSFKVKSKTE